MTTARVLSYAVRLTISRPDPQSYRSFRVYSTANLSDALGKRQTLPHQIKPVYQNCPRLLGPAITVRVSPGDEILPLKAIDVAQPGDVIVIAGAYSAQFCIWGGVMSYMAHVRGIVGLVTDGLIRDVAQIREMGFPVYAAGVTPLGTCRNVPPGDLNYPLAVGTTVITPGDLIAADEDGVVCVPADRIADIDGAVRTKEAAERQWLDAIRGTRAMIFREDVDEILSARDATVVGAGPAGGSASSQ